MPYEVVTLIKSRVVVLVTQRIPMPIFKQQLAREYSGTFSSERDVSLRSWRRPKTRRTRRGNIVRDSK